MSVHGAETQTLPEAHLLHAGRECDGRKHNSSAKQWQCCRGGFIIPVSSSAGAQHRVSLVSSCQSDAEFLHSSRSERVDRQWVCGAVTGQTPKMPMLESADERCTPSMDVAVSTNHRCCECAQCSPRSTAHQFVSLGDPFVRHQLTRHSYDGQVLFADQCHGLCGLHIWIAEPLILGRCHRQITVAASFCPGVLRDCVDLSCMSITCRTSPPTCSLF